MEQTTVCTKARRDLTKNPNRDAFNIVSGPTLRLGTHFIAFSLQCLDASNQFPVAMKF